MAGSAAPRRTTLIIFLVLVASLGAALIGAEIMLGGRPARSVATGQSASPPSAGAAQTALAASAIYQQAAKGVVTINAQGGRSPGTGSGIVLDRNGTILTANHVIEGAGRVQVTFSDGTTATASVVSTNPAQDLATLRVSVSASRLHPLTLGDSNGVLVGDTVYAIGAPFGHEESMGHGVVSGLNRSDQSTGIKGLIQTDVRLNPGNSGGPLLNTLGQVIGVNIAIDSPILGSVGVGFAVPINQARPAEGGNL